MFLHIENLELLWRALQKSPYLVEFSQKTIVGEKERWFRESCEQFHRKWMSQTDKSPANSRELLEMNKHALRYMTEELKRALGYSQTTITNHRKEDLTSYNVAAERKQRAYARSTEFDQYQAEYNRLLERPSVPANVFPTFSGEEKITNMEELVQQHLKMRDVDLTMHSNEPPANAPPVFATKSPKLKILDSIETIDLEIGTLSSSEEYPLNYPEEKAKTVHWA